MSRFIQIEFNFLIVRITVCIESFFLLAGALLFAKKSAKVLQYVGLDCGMLDFFKYSTHEP
jgi:hypothetical protein